MRDPNHGEAGMKTAHGGCRLVSFIYLFLITGVASLFALLIFLPIFLYKNGHLLRDSSVPFGQRLREIGKCFLEKDLSHHTARTNDGQPIGNGDPANSPPNADVLPIGSGHAKNSPHSANGETTAQIAEVNTHEQQSQPLNPEPRPLSSISMGETGSRAVY
ncbi:Glutamate receptor 2.9 [Cinnamomum micranthum f. kanehirae]|uniref:Glutamate receptor 2.9 n=1 Tax=Cinnamomum micranthum f. kanehirae TaxID=337451 RepID=A0A3S3MFC4_9MAGN|nr:Glutamate receptor 2.9 [Cinnamomum micranthum f. kanehirae]